MNRNEMADRKLEVMKAAAYRWKQNEASIAVTRERLKVRGALETASRGQVADFLARERLKLTSAEYQRIVAERIIRGNQMEDTPRTMGARKAGTPVARIVELNDQGEIRDGIATGFLITSSLLITNWHVFEKPSDAIGYGAQFGFEKDEHNILQSGATFELDPKVFFISDKTLDIAIVAVKNAAVLGSESLASYGEVILIPTAAKILVGQPVSIIQHPDGKYKHWAVQQNELVLEPKPEDLFLTYETDTLPGSSGSPAFNQDWELVAIHHSGVPRMVNEEIIMVDGSVWRPGLPDDRIDWIANEGARVSKVYEYLKNLRLQNTSEQSRLARLIAGVRDPVLETESAAGLSFGGSRKVEQLPRSWNVVVNGTANFYFTNPEPPAVASQIPPLAGAQLSVGPGIEKKILFDPDYATRRGYQSNFLNGFDIPIPEASLDEVLQDSGQQRILPYHHYSLAMHKKRRLAMWTASNVDYDKSKRWRKREEFGQDSWKPDPRIPIEAQIEDLEFYKPAAKFDRGHLVRRDDVAWGENQQEEEYGNSDSFHWTNCTPQHAGFNRDMYSYKGLWGQVEHHIANQGQFVGNRLIIFAGPVLDSNDPSRDFGSGIEVQVPIVFWKVVVVVEDVDGNRKLRAYGFLLDQTAAIQTYGWEGRFSAGKFKEQQVSLGEIIERSRVTFSNILIDADPLQDARDEARRRSLRTLGDLKLN